VIVLSFLVVVLVVGAIVDVIRSPASLVKRGSKPGWLLAVIFLPVIGGALWFAFGRRRGDYDLDEYAEDTATDAATDPARAAERIRSVEGPVAHADAVERAPDAAGAASGPPRPEGARTTEEQLADLEAEIAYWEQWARENGSAEGAESAETAGAKETSGADRESTGRD
jgi:hypothetical protein